MLTKTQLMGISKKALVDQILVERDVKIELKADLLNCQEELDGAKDFAKSQAENAAQLLEKNREMDLEVAKLRLTVANMGKWIHGGFRPEGY